MNEASTEASKDNVISLLQLLFKIPKHQGHTCRTGVSVAVDVYQHLLGLHADTLSYRFDNAKVGLVRHNVVNIIGCSAIALKQFGAVVAHCRHGIAVNSATFLIGIV